MSSRMKAQLVVGALQMTICQRESKDGLIMHTNKALLYASHQYRSLLSTHGITGSMSKR